MTPVRVARCAHRCGARWRHLAARCDDGSASIEFMIVVPMVLVAMFLAIQVAMFSYARSIALGAAQEGLDAERAYGAPAGAGASKANSLLDRAAGDWLNQRGVDVQGNGEQVTVTVTGRSLSILPGIPGWQVRQTATGPRERFVP